MEKFNRAVRRHHAKRLKKNRRLFWGRDMPRWDQTQNATLTERELGIVVDTPTPCSCFMCGNARKHFGYRTIQELRLMQDNGDYSSVG